MILSNEPDLGKKINSAVFPRLQGGPLMHVIAAKTVAFGGNGGSLAGMHDDKHEDGDKNGFRNH
jgi:hypothetical protein